MAAVNRVVSPTA